MKPWGIQFASPIATPLAHLREQWDQQQQGMTKPVNNEGPSQRSGAPIGAYKPMAIRRTQCPFSLGFTPTPVHSKRPGHMEASGRPQTLRELEPRSMTLHQVARALRQVTCLFLFLRLITVDEDMLGLPLP